MTLASRVAQFEQDVDTVHDIVHGPAAGDGSLVPTDGGPLKTLAKLLADAQSTIDEVAGLRGDLAEQTGAGLVGSATGETVQTALDARLPEIGTYALLRAYSGPLTAYYVRGVASLFDGGAGVFRVDASDTTSADNGGTILVDASGRRWKREFSGAINVLWFGAKGDGATDDAPSIRSAAAYCKLHRRTLFVPPPRAQYLLGSTVTIDSHSLIGDMPVDPTLAVAQFKCAGNFNAFLVKGSRLKIAGIGVEYPSGGALATADAVGFLFGDATTQFSRSIVSQCFVRYAYDGFKTNSAGTGTIWGCRFEHCNADSFVNRPFNFNAVNGSTTCSFDFCYGHGDVSGGNKPKGFYFNNITDITAGILAVDLIFNDALQINNGNAVIQEFRMESCTLDAASAVLILTAAATVDIRQIFHTATTGNVGAGNRAGIIRCGSSAATSAKIGQIHGQFATATSGTLYKVIIGTVAYPRAISIEDPSIKHADIYYAGYDICVAVNGRITIPSAAYLLAGITWEAGDFVWKRTPVEAGTAGAKYIETGWSRVTAGSGQAVNADWFASRALTGN